VTERLETRLRVSLTTDSDVGIARIRTHDLALEEGLTEVQATAVATAVSELTRNVIVHAARGELMLSVVVDGERRGILAVVADVGPGIPDIERALEDGYSTVGTLGLGFPSARRLVDEFHVVSVLGIGTTVRVKKWSRG
jgi:serine/threonine-protein kinase RsbT